MVIKDFECPHCGRVYERIVSSGDVCNLLARCPTCKKAGEHEALCNGGIRHRWRYCDWGGVDLSENIRVSGVEAFHYDDDGNKVTAVDADGVPYADNKLFSEESHDARRDVIKSNRRRAKGDAPIFIDQKGVK